MTTPQLQEIDAETQIFTPGYVVRFLVENSIGRLWMRSHPESKLADSDNLRMYVPLPEPDNLVTVDSPEEIRVIDPACGTGNILCGAFDLLYAIYEDAGYKPADIPGLILTKNLYGIDLDEQAAAYAVHRLLAVASAVQPMFFRKGIVPHITVAEDSLVGSLVHTDDQYECVIANPPYMGSKHFTPALRDFAKTNYPDSKGDLCTMFIERCLGYTVPGGLTAMITMEGWMFLSSYEALRKKILANQHIATMAHFGAGVFGRGAVISTTAFVLDNANPGDDMTGLFFQLVNDKDKEAVLRYNVAEYRKLMKAKAVA
jgi:type I restriction-modification system DNA methylase subunit